MSLSKLKALVDQAFSKHLLLTNFGLGTTFMLTGDFLAQKMSGYPKHDWQRTKNMAIMGTGFGFLGHHWYRFLDRRFPGATWVSIRRKLLAECAATPLFAGYVFFAFGSLGGKSLKTCAEDFKENLKFVVAVDWFIYVPVQAINFRYLPPKYRFLFVCGITVIYDVFLAWILNRNNLPHLKSLKIEDTEDKKSKNEKTDAS